MTPTYISIESGVDPLWLAHQLADTLDNEGLVDFVLAIDDRRAEMDFTVGLYARLGDIIRDELGADTKQDIDL